MVGSTEERIVPFPKKCVECIILISVSVLFKRVQDRGLTSFTASTLFYSAPESHVTRPDLPLQLRSLYLYRVEFSLSYQTVA